MELVLTKKQKNPEVYVYPTSSMALFRAIAFSNHRHEWCVSRFNEDNNSNYCSKHFTLLGATNSKTEQDLVKKIKPKLSFYYTLYDLVYRSEVDKDVEKEKIVNGIRRLQIKFKEERLRKMGKYRRLSLKN